MDNEVNMKMIVIHRSKIMLLIAHARACELLITFEADQNRYPLLTVATSINNNKYMYI